VFFADPSQIPASFKVSAAASDAAQPRLISGW